MKRIISYLMAVIITATAFAGFETAKAARSVDFDLNLSRTLDYTLQEIPKNNTFKDDAYLYWYMDRLDEATASNVDYELTYHPFDDTQVDFTMKRTNDSAEITFKNLTSAGGYTNMVDPNYDTLRVFHNGNWITPTAATYPVVNGSGIIYNGNDPLNKGTNDGIRIDLKKDAGIIIAYGGEIIKMKWDGDVFKYTTDSVSPGKIVDFTLKAKSTTTPSHDAGTTLSAFQGVSGFESAPTADNRVSGGSIDSLTGVLHNTWVELNKISGTNVPNPAEKPGMVLSFDLPKKWDIGTNAYVAINTTEAAKYEAVLDIKSNLANEEFSIKADPLTGTATLTNARPTDTAVLHQNFIANDKIFFDVQTLPSGVIYDVTSITVAKKDDLSFKTRLLNIEKGKVYTFLEYSVVAASPTEYYLRIIPYKNTPGYYTAYTGTTSIALDQWARVDEKTGVVSLEIPIKPSQSGSWYQIEFTLVSPSEDVVSTEQKLHSQKLGIKPDDAFLELPTPKNLEIIPTIVSNGSTSDLILDISFDLGHKSVFDALIARGINEVNYKIFHAYLSEDNFDNPFEDFEVDITGLDSDPPNAVSILDIPNPANAVLQNSRIEKRQEIIGDTSSPSGYEDIYRVHITYKIPAYDLNAGAGSGQGNVADYEFAFPNIYKLWVIGHYEESSIEKETGRSNIVNITLDSKSKVEVPPPQDIRIHDETPYETTKDSFAVSFSTIRQTLLSDYLKFMLQPKALSLGTDSVLYNYYISQSKSKMDLLKENINAQVAGETEPHPTLKIWVAAEPAPTTPPPYEFDVETMTVTNGGTSITAREALRQGDIVQIPYIEQDGTVSRQIYKLIGLDENQAYYGAVNTIIWPYDVLTNLRVTDLDEVKVSKLSSIVTETTLKEPEAPTTSEKTPPTPINFEVIDYGDGYVKLYWDKIIEVKNDENADDVIEYQLFKMVGSPVEEAILKLKDAFNVFYNKQPTNFLKEGLETDGTEIHLYTGSGFATANAPDTEYVYDSLTDPNGNMLTDKTLYPNKIHYYYLRAVRINTVTGEMVYSEWTPLTHTSEPIKAPINLEIIRENVTYDKFTEIYIGFDAPISDLSKLGTDIDIEYQLKEDEGDWLEPVRMSPSELKANADVSDLLGYSYFSYKITGLKSGTMYYIRVRLVDKTFDDVSLYSNIVSHRTNSDQDDVDKSDQVNKWEQIFDQEIAKIYKNPYWVLRDTKTELEILYRNDFKQQELQKAINGMYALGDNTNRNKTIYIPADFLIYANETGKGFEVVNEIVSVMMPNKHVTVQQTQAIKDAISTIDEKRAVDYALKIVINQTVLSGQVNGENPASPRIELIVTVVTLRQAEKALSLEFELKYNNMFVDENIRGDLRLELAEMLDDDDSAQEITLVIKDFAADFAKELSSYMRGRVLRAIRDEINVTSFNNDIAIVAKVDTSLTVSGYTYTTAWIKKETSDYGGRKAIYTKNSGVFIFAGFTLNIPGLSGITGADEFKKMYEKYGFDEFFGKDYINTNATSTGRVVYGTLARLTGAPKGANYADYLKQKGVRVAASKMDKALSQEEVIYAVMMAYEIKTGTKIESIKITNYNILQGITVSETYKRHVMVAVQLNIVDKSVLKPKEQMTTLEYMKILSRLSSKISF